jgi:hypothetical protein
MPKAQNAPSDASIPYFLLLCYFGFRAIEEGDQDKALRIFEIAFGLN